MRIVVLLPQFRQLVQQFLDLPCILGAPREIAPFMRVAGEIEKQSLVDQRMANEFPPIIADRALTVL